MQGFRRLGARDARAPKAGRVFAVKGAVFPPGFCAFWPFRFFSWANFAFFLHLQLLRPLRGRFLLTARKTKRNRRENHCFSGQKNRGSGPASGVFARKDPQFCRRTTPTVSISGGAAGDGRQWAAFPGAGSRRQRPGTNGAGGKRPARAVICQHMRPPARVGLRFRVRPRFHGRTLTPGNQCVRVLFSGAVPKVIVCFKFKILREPIHFTELAGVSAYREGGDGTAHALLEADISNRQSCQTHSAFPPAPAQWPPAPAGSFHCHL